MPGVTGAGHTSITIVAPTVLDLLRLDGKLALVTGGSRGLGLQMAEALGEAGATVALTARGAAGLAEAEQHLQASGINAHGVVCDIAQPETIPAVIEQITDQLGPIDILVNNAGTTWGAAFADITAASWHKVIRTNLDGTFSVTREVTERMVARASGGKVIVISSIAGLRGSDPRVLQTLAYNTSKGGLIEFTRSLARTLAPYQINVNCICPGFFRTRLAGVVIDRAHDQIVDRTPLGRVGGADDLKGLVVLLASAASAAITGQIIAIDGGASVT
jgi:gluconate 5-dehydrogenase